MQIIGFENNISSEEGGSGRGRLKTDWGGGWKHKLGERNNTTNVTVRFQLIINYVFIYVIVI
jgi:hypothetical protein